MNFFETIIGIFVVIIFMPFFNEVADKSREEYRKKEEEKRLRHIIEENSHRW